MSERLKIIVFTENDKQETKYYNLFRFLLAEKVVAGNASSGMRTLCTDEADIFFYRGLTSDKGKRCHYLINLTQDKEWNESIRYIECPAQEQLNRDDRWSSLFKRLNIE